ncbi:phosphatidylinositol-glycan biosynthesis class X protein [Sturnira hondurensis]|uniref:phosphatidylinositol-glycan biosynthesis class X protein n=1 Tax=Sturnira hondurensis TaxID=192404 RepID=UPI001879F713|nr:phosphatidylinositol-glycan biosynthesis class X protein [Sturnira hondurensis]
MEFWRPESTNTWRWRSRTTTRRSRSAASVPRPPSGSGPKKPFPPKKPRCSQRRLRLSLPRPQPEQQGAGLANAESEARVSECRLWRVWKFRAPGLRGPREAYAGFSFRISPGRAPLRREFFGVLAAPALVVVVRVLAWIFLWESAGLTCTTATTLNAAPTDAGIRATCSEIILQQEVLKDGFHRDLLIKVKFGESMENLQTCRLLIKQYIPAGLFVDPYELASLRERNITEAVMVSEDFNIEAPNYLSEESEVLIYARRDSQCTDCFQALLPVHYRYHQPHSEDGEVFIVVNNPDLLMYCDQEFPILKCWSQSKVAAPCALKSKDICQWNNMKYKSVYENVTLQVPVGLTTHTSLVCSVTLLITILCSTLILVAVFKHGHSTL